MKKRWILLSAFFCTSIISFAQVGLGTHFPNLSSQLHISATDKGVLIPQVKLKNLTDDETIANGNVTSLLVYNTTKEGDLIPGYYYWKEDSWTRLLTSIDDSVVDFPTNSNFVVEDDILKLFDSKGNFVDIGIDKLNIITSLVKKPNGNGVYTYTDEKGVGVDIDIPAEVIENFQQIVNNTQVEEILNTIIKTNGGNVFYDGSLLTWKKPDGTFDNVDLATVVKDNETLTSLENVVTQETDDSGQEIDVYTLTYTDEAGSQHPIDIKVLVKGSETLTTLDYDPGQNILTYTNEAGENTVLHLRDIIKGVETLTSLEFDIDKDLLSYTDEWGVVNSFNLQTINKHPWNDASNHKLATSNTANIYTLGWVGIGFTEPSSSPNEKLRVNGSITAVNSYYADYVFESYFDGYSDLNYSYNFNSLDNVEEFIKENRHLPGITPIDELDTSESGYVINLSELSVQLLEKTEELYLHMIDQNKELQQKEARIKELEKTNQSMLEKVNLLEQKESRINKLEQANEQMLKKLEMLEIALEKFI
ncbi:hypothetical protein ACYSNV_04825 [Myroides sp. LJL119]